MKPGSGSLSKFRAALGLGGSTWISVKRSLSIGIIVMIRWHQMPSLQMD